MVIFIAALAWFWVKEKGQKYLDPKVEDSLWHKVSEFKQNHIRRSNDRFLEHIPFVEDIVPSDSVRTSKIAMHRRDLLRDEQQRLAVDGSTMKDELFKNAVLQRYSTVRKLELNKDGDGDNMQFMEVESKFNGQGVVAGGSLASSMGNRLDDDGFVTLVTSGKNTTSGDNEESGLLKDRK